MGQLYAVSVVVEIAKIVKDSFDEFEVKFFIIRLKIKPLFIIFSLELINNRYNNAGYLPESNFLRVRVFIIVSFKQSIPSFRIISHLGNSVCYSFIFIA